MEKLYCRLCLKNDLWNVPLFLFADGLLLPQKIKDVFGIEIKESKELSNVICHLCLAKLEFAYGFVESVKNNDKILTNVIQVTRKCVEVAPSLSSANTALTSSNQSPRYIPKIVVSKVDSSLNDESVDSKLSNTDEGSENKKKSEDDEINRVSEEEESDAENGDKEVKRDDVDMWIICQKCNFMTQRRCAMLSHMKKHDRVWLRHCPRCSCSFDKEGDLINHLKTYHKQKKVVMEYYACEVCKKGFMDKKLFTKHKQLHDKNNGNKKKESKEDDESEEDLEEKEEKPVSSPKVVAKDTTESKENKSKSNSKKTEVDNKQPKENNDNSSKNSKKSDSSKSSSHVKNEKNVKKSSSSIAKDSQSKSSKSASSKNSPTKTKSNIDNKNNTNSKKKKCTNDEVKVTKKKSLPSNKEKNVNKVMVPVKAQSDKVESETETDDDYKEPERKKKKRDVSKKTVGDVDKNGAMGQEGCEMSKDEAKVKMPTENVSAMETSDSIRKEEEDKRLSKPDSEDSDIDIDMMIESEMLQMAEVAKKLERNNSGVKKQCELGLQKNKRKSPNVGPSEHSKNFKPIIEENKKYNGRSDFDSDLGKRNRTENLKGLNLNSDVNPPSKSTSVKKEGSTNLRPNSEKEVVKIVNLSVSSSNKAKCGDKLESKSYNCHASSVKTPNPADKTKMKENISGEKSTCTVRISSNNSSKKKNSFEDALKMITFVDRNKEHKTSRKSIISMNNGEENPTGEMVTCGERNCSVSGKTLVVNIRSKENERKTNEKEKSKQAGGDHNSKFFKCHMLSKSTTPNRTEENSSATGKGRTSDNCNGSRNANIVILSRSNESLIDENCKPAGFGVFKKQYTLCKLTKISHTTEENVSSFTSDNCNNKNTSKSTEVSSRSKENLTDFRLNEKCTAALSKSTASNTNENLNSCTVDKTNKTAEVSKSVTDERLRSTGHYFVPVKCNASDTKSMLSNYMEENVNCCTLGNDNISSTVLNSLSEEERVKPTGQCTPVKDSASTKSTILNNMQEKLNNILSKTTIMSNRSKENPTDPRLKPTEHFTPSVCGATIEPLNNMQEKLNNMLSKTTIMSNRSKENPTDPRLKPTEHFTPSVCGATIEPLNTMQEKLNNMLSKTTIMLNRSKENPTDPRLEPTEHFTPSVCGATIEPMILNKTEANVNCFTSNCLISSRRNVRIADEKCSSPGYEYTRQKTKVIVSQSNKTEQNVTGECLRSKVYESSNINALNKILDVVKQTKGSINDEKLKFTQREYESDSAEVSVTENIRQTCESSTNVLKVKEEPVNDASISLSDEADALVIDESRCEVKEELHSSHLAEEFPIVIDEIKVESEEEDSEMVLNLDSSSQDSNGEKSTEHASSPGNEGVLEDYIDKTMSFLSMSFRRNI